MSSVPASVKVLQAFKSATTSNEALCLTVPKTTANLDRSDLEQLPVASIPVKRMAGRMGNVQVTVRKLTISPGGYRAEFVAN